MTVRSQAQSLKAMMVAHGVFDLPQNDFRDFSSHAFGGEITAGLGIKSTMFTGTAGYHSFANAYIGSPMRMVPLLLGVRQGVKGGLFVNANAGLAMLSRGDDRAQKFLVEGGVGFRVQTLDLVVNYAGVNNPYAIGGTWLGFWSFKAGISFIRY